MEAGTATCPPGDCWNFIHPADPAARTACEGCRAFTARASDDAAADTPIKRDILYRKIHAGCCRRVPAQSLLPQTRLLSLPWFRGCGGGIMDEICFYPTRPTSRPPSTMLKRLALVAACIASATAFTGEDLPPNHRCCSVACAGSRRGSSAVGRAGEGGRGAWGTLAARKGRRPREPRARGGQRQEEDVIPNTLAHMFPNILPLALLGRACVCSFQYLLLTRWCCCGFQRRSVSPVPRVHSPRPMPSPPSVPSPWPLPSSVPTLWTPSRLSTSTHPQLVI
jgi:hypothetical protein